MNNRPQTQMMECNTVLDNIHRPAFYLKRKREKFAPHWKHITSPRRAQKVNAIYRFLTTVYDTTVTILDIVHRHVFHLNHARVMFVPHWKHITALLRTQPVKAICRFVTMVY
jgi:Txe/YoeB family toxin of Txe-Axe toxin-antitoxin module